MQTDVVANLGYRGGAIRIQTPHMGVGQGCHPKALEGRNTGTKEHGRNVGEELIRQVRHEEYPDKLGTALHQDVPHAPPIQFLQYCGGVVRPQVNEALAAHRRVIGNVPLTDGDPERLAVRVGTVERPRSQAGVVCKDGSGADEDCINPGADGVAVRTGMRSGDPLA